MSTTQLPVTNYQLPNQGDPLYQLTNIEQWYNGRPILNIPHLAIQRGEILAIVGPSGAGKSTLLRLLNFLEQPSQGQITFDNQPVTADLPLAQRRRVTTVFQQPLLLKTKRPGKSQLRPILTWRKASPRNGRYLVSAVRFKTPCQPTRPQTLRRRSPTSCPGPCPAYSPRCPPPRRTHRQPRPLQRRPHRKYYP